MMRGFRRARGRRSQPLSSALGLFVILCGLILLAGSRGGCANERELKMQQALQRVEQALHAVEGSNFGEARVHLQRLRQTLHEAADDNR